MSLQNRSAKQKRDWYTISVTTLQGWGLFLLLALVAGGGYLGYRYWQTVGIQRAAAQVIDESRVLLQQLGGEDATVSRQQYETAFNGIEDARRLYDGGEFRPALDRARDTKRFIETLIAPIERSSGIAEFNIVQGNVEYRRGELGEWEPARARVVLERGDYVRTDSGGSAMIRFDDNTTYSVRPNTLFQVSAAQATGRGRAPRSIDLQYGWINLNTGQQGGRVATPTAEATVEDDSEATVGFDEERSTGSFTSFRGAIQVQAGEESKRVEAMHSLASTGSALSDPKPIPPAPRLLEPDQNGDFDRDKVEELVLAWSVVDGAAAYALQVSRNRLFVDNVIDVESRDTTRATLGLQGDGAFLWRVASINEDGLQGPWVEPGRFRVSSRRGSNESGDTEPPDLSIDEIQAYGTIFIVKGTTEPGSSVWVGPEPVAVEADGGFTKTLQLIQSGWTYIEVRAVDAWGNETKKRQRVFVEGL